MYEFLTLPNSQPQNKMPFLLTLAFQFLYYFVLSLMKKKKESNLLTYELYVDIFLRVEKSM